MGDRRGAACTARYLNRVLEVRAAEVVVVFGTVARDVVASALSIPASGVVLHAAARRKRLVAYLPHQTPAESASRSQRTSATSCPHCAPRSPDGSAGGADAENPDANADYVRRV